MASDGVEQNGSAPMRRCSMSRQLPPPANMSAVCTSTFPRSERQVIFTPRHLDNAKRRHNRSAKHPRSAVPRRPSPRYHRVPPRRDECCRRSLWRWLLLGMLLFRTQKVSPSGRAYPQTQSVQLNGHREEFGIATASGAIQSKKWPPISFMWPLMAPPGAPGGLRPCRPPLHKAAHLVHVEAASGEGWMCSTKFAPVAPRRCSRYVAQSIMLGV